MAFVRDGAVCRGEASSGVRRINYGCQRLSYLINELCNPQAVGNLLDEVESAYDALVENPEAFEMCRDQRLAELEYRKAQIGNYLMIYQYDSELDEINVMRFFHEAQNYSSMM